MERDAGPAFAALCGLLFPILIIVGHDVIGAVAGEAPGRGASAAEAMEHALESDATRFYAGGFLGSAVAGLTLLVFVAYVASLIRRWDDGWMPGAALGAGVVAVGLQLATMPIVFAAVRWADELEAATVAAILVDLSQTWALTFVPLAAFVAIASVATIRGDLMARWIGWLGIVLAPLAVVGAWVQFSADSEVGLAFIPIILTWILWMPAAGISLALRARRVSRAAR